MATVNTSFYDNQFEAVKHTKEKSGMIKDGTIIPKSDTVTDNGYELQKMLMLQSSMVENAISNRFKKIFTKNIDRQYETSPAGDIVYVNALVENTDNTGQNMSEFSYEYIEKVATYGFCFIDMDDYPEDEKSSNIDEMIQKRQLPFFSSIEPQQVIKEDYLFDKGVMIKFSYKYTVKNDKGEDVEYTKTIDTENVTVYEGDDKTPISQVPHDFWEKTGAIPVKIVKGTNKIKDQDLLKSVPTIMNVVRVSNNTLILQNVADYSAHQNCLNQMVIAADKELRAEMREKGATVKVGNQNALFIDPNANQTHQFLAPSAGNIDQIREGNKEKIKQAMMEEGMRYTEGATAQSGDSKAYDQDQVNTSLSFYAKTAQDAEEWIINTFCTYMDITLTELEIDYETEYGLDVVSSQIDDLFKFAEGANDIGAFNAVKVALKEQAKLLFEKTALDEATTSIDDTIEKEPTEVIF